MQAKPLMFPKSGFTITDGEQTFFFDAKDLLNGWKLLLWISNCFPEQDWINPCQPGRDRTNTL